MILTLGTTPALQRTMTFSRLTIDAVNRATSIREYASGKGINVARVVHRLRKPCVATGFLGGDSGSFCRHDMDAAGIGHDFVTVASRTRMCVTLVDQASRTATELIEEAGPVTASDTAKLLVKLELLLQHARVLVLSGTLAPGCGDDFYARCLRLAATTNVPAILDAKGAPLQLALAERPFVVKPNRVELSATVNHAIESDGQLRDAMRQIISRGANWVVVTNGPDETLVSDGRTFWRLTTPKVDVISPIGSGDSFAAGMAAGLVGEQEVPDACVLGVACGAANAMTELAGDVRREEVERLQKQIPIERVV